MSKGLGIIAEYNPFHNGHLYHIQNAKEQANADYVIAIMTGNFTQRGSTSIINKWEKTKMALYGGVDLIIELPTLYSISSAENFASGAIKILDELGIVDSISFGMEASNLSLLNNIANILYSENSKYQAFLKKELDKGNSFPRARQHAIMNFIGNDKRYENIMQGSNNILAIEYLKALKRQRSKLNPIGIQRQKVFYNSNKIIDEYASSTGIRQLLLNNNISEIAKVVPSTTFSILMENIKNGTYTNDLNDFSSELIYKLRSMDANDFKKLPDVSEGLENSFISASGKTNNIINLINTIRSKRYTQTRIQRILLYSLLGITRKDIEMSKTIKPYIRVLGCSRQGQKLLSSINKKCTVITSVKKFENKNLNKKYKRMLDIDKYATDIYTIGYKNNSKCNLDYTNGIILM